MLYNNYSADSISGNGLILSKDATSFNIDNLFGLGFFFLHNTNSDSRLGTYPTNYYAPYGHLWNFPEDTVNQAARMQILTSYSCLDEKIYYRKYSGINEGKSQMYSDWMQLYPYYSSISLQVNGYIIFTNGLMLQWARDMQNDTNNNSDTDSNVVESIVTLPLNFNYDIAHIFANAVTEEGKVDIDNTGVAWSGNTYIKTNANGNNPKIRIKYTRIGRWGHSWIRIFAIGY